MNGTIFHILMRRLSPLLPVAILAAACATAALVLSSCGGERPVALERPVVEGVPCIRVLLTPSPVRQEWFSTTGGYQLLADGRVVRSSGGPMVPQRVTRCGRTWRFGGEIEGGRLELKPSLGGFVRCGTTVYRGTLRLVPIAGETFLVINVLDLESYLAGVLAKELLSSWSVETYAALAIAARTFAMYHMNNGGSAREYDVGADQGWQVYGGVSAESEKAWQAVHRTRGRVLAYGPRGHERVFLAQYSACCGGWVNGAQVLRNAPRIPPLKGGQRCEDCKDCPYYRWPPVRIGKEEFCRAVAEAYPSEKPLGRLLAVRPAVETPYGRAIWLDIVGSGNVIRLRAEDLRLALLRSRVTAARRIYSMNCRIRVLQDKVEFYDGRGFGHGVGLCQWGAEGKARRGWTAQQILQFYYPGAKQMIAY